jgi:hypothetical protein
MARGTARVAGGIGGIDIPARREMQAISMTYNSVSDTGFRSGASSDASDLNDL